MIFLWFIIFGAIGVCMNLSWLSLLVIDRVVYSIMRRFYLHYFLSSVDKIAYP